MPWSMEIRGKCRDGSASVPRRLRFDPGKQFVKPAGKNIESILQGLNQPEKTNPPKSPFVKGGLRGIILNVMNKEHVLSGAKK